MIENHSEIAKAIGGYDDDEPWYISTKGAVVTGTTFMDNFDMRHFLVNVVGISENIIKWS